MQKVGEYDYPNLATFSDALAVAEDAVKKYGGIIPNAEAAKKLGYSIKDPSAISGTIYRRFDDVCAFGLTVRDRGGLKATNLATDALDPYDEAKAAEAKAKAIRSVKLIATAYEAWKGEVPREDAFPAKIAAIASVPWTEAQKHSAILRPLVSETFGILGTAPRKAAEPMKESPRLDKAEVSEAPRGELRTTAGSITITDLDTLSIAEQYLALLKKQLSTKKTETNGKSRVSRQASSG